MNKRFWLLLALAASLAMSFSAAQAATLTWDVGLWDGPTITDGGTADSYMYWVNQDSYYAAWNDGTDSTMWNNANLDVAQFGTPTSATNIAYIVEPSGTVVAGGLTFYRGYSIGMSTGGSELTLGGTNPVITMVAPDSGTPQNYLYANLYAPDATTIQIRGHASSSTYSRLYLNGYNSYTGTLEILDGGFVYAKAGALDPNLAGIVVHDNCMLSIQEAGVYDLADIHISGFGPAATATAISDKRAALSLAAGSAGNQEWKGNIILDGDAAINNNTNTGLTNIISGVISGNFGLTKTGPGVITLTGQNTYTGATQLYRGGLTLDCQTGYAISGDLVFLSGYGAQTMTMIHGDDDGMPQIAPTAAVRFKTGTYAGHLLKLNGHTLTIAGLDASDTTSSSAYAVQNDAADCVATLVLDSDGNYSYRGKLRDRSVTSIANSTLRVIKRGIGEQTLDGNAHTFTSGLTIEEGSIRYGANTTATSHYSASLVVKQGATLNVTDWAGFTVTNAMTGYGVAGPNQILSGGGTIVGDVAVGVGGSISPGESAGVMTFTNGVDFSTGGDFTWELSALVDQTTGVPGTEFDYLAVNGNVTLDGTSQLTIDLTAVGTPDESVPFWTTAHSWKIIDVGATSVTTGLFATLVNGEYEAGDFTTSVDAAGDVFLNYSTGSTVTLPGDATGDGFVTDLDAQRLASNWLRSGMGWSDGDFTGDGVVDDRDAAILAAHWVRGTEGASVPEPGTLALLAAGLAALGWLRRRK